MAIGLSDGAMPAGAPPAVATCYHERNPRGGARVWGSEGHAPTTARLDPKMPGM